MSHVCWTKKNLSIYVPVVSSDVRKILTNVASKLPEDAGRRLMAQVDYVARRPYTDGQILQYELMPGAPHLEGLTGIQELATVEMCYYRQAMPFVVFLRDGLLFRVESRDPKPLADPPEEYTVLRVTLMRNRVSQT